jgi:hypothetical protein
VSNGWVIFWPPPQKPTPFLPPFLPPPLLPNVITNTLLLPTLQQQIKYPDLNSDIMVQKNITNKIWRKLKGTWIYNYTKLFKFIKGSKGNYKLVDSLKEAEHNQYGSQEIENKIDWFLSNIYTKSNLLGTLEKFRANTNLDLWKVDEDEDLLKDFIYHQIKRKLFNKLSN